MLQAELPMTDTESRDPSQADPGYEERLKAFRRKAEEEAALELQTDTGFRLPLDLPPEIRIRYEQRLEGCRKTWEETGDPFAAAEALTWAFHYRQAVEPWIEQAMVQMSIQVRRDVQAERHRDSMNDIERYTYFRDIKKAGVKGGILQATADRFCVDVEAVRKSSKRVRDNYKDPKHTTGRYRYRNLKDVRYRSGR